MCRVGGAPKTRFEKHGYRTFLSLPFRYKILQRDGFECLID